MYITVLSSLRIGVSTDNKSVVTNTSLVEEELKLKTHETLSPLEQIVF